MKIYYSKPSITKTEIRHVMKAAKYGWGDKCYDYINLFERKFQSFIKKYGNGESPISRNTDGTRNKDKVFLDNNLQFYRSGRMPEERYKLTRKTSGVRRVHYQAGYK